MVGHLINLTWNYFLKKCIIIFRLPECACRGQNILHYLGINVCRTRLDRTQATAAAGNSTNAPLEKRVRRSSNLYSGLLYCFPPLPIIFDKKLSI